MASAMSELVTFKCPRCGIEIGGPEGSIATCQGAKDDTASTWHTPARMEPKEEPSKKTP